MTPNQQRAAVARLVTYCETMVQRGQLPTLDETNLRHFINEACTAFEMAPCQDRLEQDLEIIRKAMAS